MSLEEDNHDDDDDEHYRHLQAALTDFQSLVWEPAEWQPPLEMQGVYGSTAVLFAGTNYTMWNLTWGTPLPCCSRFLMVPTFIDRSTTAAGLCKFFNVTDRNAPFDASEQLNHTYGQGTTEVLWNENFPSPTITSWYPITFNRGGEFKICWSADGTFGQAVSYLIPDPDKIYRVYGATDTCDQPPPIGLGKASCIDDRKFFAMLPHYAYDHYYASGPKAGTQVYVMIQSVFDAPLKFSRLTWMSGVCGWEVGKKMINSTGIDLDRVEPKWATIVDPLDSIYFGRTNYSLPENYKRGTNSAELGTGFRYRLCFCPSYDADGQGTCGGESDFVQQVGYLYGLVVSFLAYDDNTVRTQVIPMTRFHIRVDCGDGPWCEDDKGSERIKIIQKSWEPIETSADIPYWFPDHGCRNAVEVEEWHSPMNCYNATSKTKTAHNCLMDGTLDPSVKNFGSVRFNPSFESGQGKAMIFDVCFVHKPAQVDGLDESSWNHTTVENLQSFTRTWWKIGQLIIEPIVVLNPTDFVVNKPQSLRIGTQDSISSKPNSSTLYSLGSTTGPIIKVVNEPSGENIQSKDCMSKRPTFKVEGIDCADPYNCQPRGVIDPSFSLTQMVVNNVDHNITLKHDAGIYAVCYCEKWYDCNTPDEWVLVGKIISSGPMGNEGWTLDTGFVQSFTLTGYGFRDENVIQILAPGQTCDGLMIGSTNVPDYTLNVRYCHPDFGGSCKKMGNEDNSTHVSDVPGGTWRYDDPKPAAYINSIQPNEFNTATEIRFTNVALLTVEDRIHFEPDTIRPLGIHWAVERDLTRIIMDPMGHEVVSIQDFGFQVTVPLTLNPFPPLVYKNATVGATWYRSNRLKVRYVKGTEFMQEARVCWGEKAGEYWREAGMLSVRDADSMDSIMLGATATGVGAIAPMMLSFKTGRSPAYREARNEMQLRIVFTNTSALDIKNAGAYGEDLPDVTGSNQVHENSQATCGRIMQEFWSDHAFGSPVPVGCYIDDDYLSAGGIYKALYILFGPLNGLAKSTRYVIVLNVQMKVPMTQAEMAALEQPLIEVVALDDVVIKPEGIVEVARVNPDKDIIPAARIGSYDPQFFNKGQGGVRLTRGLDGLSGSFLRAPDGSSIELDNLDSSGSVVEKFGFEFLLQGATKGNITATSILRLYLWPLTLWDFDFKTLCTAMMKASGNHTPLDRSPVDCSYEATLSQCIDLTPPKLDRWIDIRGEECDFYAQPGKCALDGLSYTPAHGMTAIAACCTCKGGERYNANTIFMRLPEKMDPATDLQNIQTMSLYQLGPIPPEVFFAERFGAQISNPDDERPHYTTTVGNYFTRKSPPNWASTVMTIVDLQPWGNTYEFKREPLPNDLYVRLQMPITVFATADDESGAKLEISLPEGYRCQAAVPVVPEILDDIPVPLQVLPEESPTGNGALPDSSAPISPIGEFEGNWSFVDNKCSFTFAPNMVLFENQRVWLYIQAFNPMEPMPKTDPRNFWRINFTASGNTGKPANVSMGCEYFIFEEECKENYMQFYPATSRLTWTHGAFQATIPSDEPAGWYTDRVAVLGILEDVVIQPFLFTPGVGKTTMQIWVKPDLGSFRGGMIGLKFPYTFTFETPCNARDLPRAHYVRYGPPFGQAFRRVWPLDCPRDQSCDCSADENDPSIATISLYGSMISERLYGFQIDVITPPDISNQGQLWTNESWTFKLTIMDGQAFKRDGTYTTASFDKWMPGNDHNRLESCDNVSWVMAAQPMMEPVHVNVSDMRPYVETQLLATVIIGPLRLNHTFHGRVRIRAPEGWEWEWSPAGFATFVQGTSEVDFPGGEPPAPNTLHPNVLLWDPFPYESNVSYAISTTIKVPEKPPLSTSDAFFIEFGNNESFRMEMSRIDQFLSDFMIESAVRVPMKTIQAIRDAKFEARTMVAGEPSTYWLRFELTQPIPVSGSLEIAMPYLMKMQNFTEDDDIEYWSAREADYIRLKTIPEWGSQPLPHDIFARQIVFNGMVGTPGTDGADEVHLELTSNTTEIGAGFYYIELNVTNPPLALGFNDDTFSPCGKTLCWRVYSYNTRGNYRWTLEGGVRQWWSDAPPMIDWTNQNDYYTAVPSQRLAQKMSLVEIVPLTYYELMVMGMNDRPFQRNSKIFAFKLQTYIPRDDDVMYIRAPIGWIFDGLCSVYVEPGDIFPSPLTFPTTYTDRSGQDHPVSQWPVDAQLDATRACRGDGHEAEIRLSSGLMPNTLYMIRIEIRSNPQFTPVRNTWTMSYGLETSGEVPGFDVWTFPNSFTDPIRLDWSNNDQMGRFDDPERSTLTIQFEVTNPLFGNGITEDGLNLSSMIRVIMPPLFEFVVDDENQMIQGGTCFAVILEIGDCLLCGVPFQPSLYTCEREINRQNVAWINFKGRTQLEVHHIYRLSITIFNPHIADGLEATARPFTMESFLGLPAPPAVYPDGYALDYAEVRGYKISERAALTVEVPQTEALRMGKAFVYNKSYTMKFFALLKPGDQIILHAPPLYATSEQVATFTTAFRCIQFEWRPMVWPAEAIKDNATWWRLHKPPVRPPLPAPKPSWAEGAFLVLALPLYRTTNNGTLACLSMHNSTFPYLHEPRCVNEGFDTADLLKNLSIVDKDLLIDLGVKSWAMNATLEAHLSINVSDENLTQYAIGRHHCFQHPSKKNPSYLRNQAWRTVGPNTECLDCYSRPYKRYILTEMYLEDCKALCEDVDECRAIHYLPFLRICHILVDSTSAPVGLGTNMASTQTSAHGPVKFSRFFDQGECHAFDSNPIVVSNKGQCLAYNRTASLSLTSNAEQVRMFELQTSAGLSLDDVLRLHARTEALPGMTPTELLQLNTSLGEYLASTIDLETLMPREMFLVRDQLLAHFKAQLMLENPTKFQKAIGLCGSPSGMCTQSQARAECMNDGSDLASPGHLRELLAVVDWINMNQTTRSNGWIGLKYYADTDDWYWLDGRSAFVEIGEDEDVALFGRPLGTFSEDTCIAVKICDANGTADTAMANHETKNLANGAIAKLTSGKCYPGWTWSWLPVPCSQALPSTMAICQRPICVDPDIYSDSASGPSSMTTSTTTIPPAQSTWKCLWPGACGGAWDDFDFNAMKMCCDCGGGSYDLFGTPKHTYKMSCDSSLAELDEGGTCCSNEKDRDCCQSRGECDVHTWPPGPGGGCMPGEIRSKSSRRRYGVCIPAQLQPTRPSVYQKTCDLLDEPEGGTCCGAQPIEVCCGPQGNITAQPYTDENATDGPTNAFNYTNASIEATNAPYDELHEFTEWHNGLNGSRMTTVTTTYGLPGCGMWQWPLDGGCEIGEWRYTGSRRRYGTCIPCAANSVGCGGLSPGTTWAPDAKWSLVCESCMFQGNRTFVGWMSLAACKRRCEAATECSSIDHGKLDLDGECYLNLAAFSLYDVHHSNRMNFTNCSNTTNGSNASNGSNCLNVSLYIGSATDYFVQGSSTYMKHEDLDSYDFTPAWTTFFELAGNGNDVPLVDIGEIKTKELFDTCPVVRYMLGSKVHSVYVRLSRFASLNPYELFLDYWSDENQTHVLNVDFAIHDTFDDLKHDKGAWSSCGVIFSEEADGSTKSCKNGTNNTNCSNNTQASKKFRGHEISSNAPIRFNTSNGFAYPGDCGKTHPRANQTFTRLAALLQETFWLDSGARFQIYTGAGCPTKALPPKLEMNWTDRPWGTSISAFHNYSFHTPRINITEMGGFANNCTNYLFGRTNDSHSTSFCKNCSGCNTSLIENVTAEYENMTWLCIHAESMNANGCSSRCNCSRSFDELTSDTSPLELECPYAKNIFGRIDNTSCLDECLTRLTQIPPLIEEICTEIGKGELPHSREFNFTETEPMPIAMQLRPSPTALSCELEEIEEEEEEEEEAATAKERGKEGDEAGQQDLVHCNPSNGSQNVSCNVSASNASRRLDAHVANMTNMTEVNKRPLKCGCFCCEQYFVADVVWLVFGNHSDTLENYTLNYEAAVRLRNWDLYPVQADPECRDNLVIMNLTKDNLHPEPAMRNGTTLAFALGYQNPRTPPLDHENYWMVRHHQDNQVSSSDAVKSWRVIANLRYLRFELRNEPLRPTDYATCHLEFVTENPADALDIYGISPVGWRFDDAYVSSPVTDQLFPKYRRLGARERRLGWPYTWKGYTAGCEVQSASGNHLRLKVNLQRSEYTRILISGINLPWTGGQALLSFFTSIRGISQDELKNCCYPGQPAVNPAVVFHVPYRLLGLGAKILNKYQQTPALYPVMYAFVTRYDEVVQCTFTFRMPLHHEPNSDIVFVVRSPQGYFLRNRTFIVREGDNTKQDDEEGAFTQIPSYKYLYSSTRTLITVPGTSKMPNNAKFQIEYLAFTPDNGSAIAPTESQQSLFIIEVTEVDRIEEGSRSLILGRVDQPHLHSQINISVSVVRSPPEVLIEVSVTLHGFGGKPPTRLDVHAPLGYTFKDNCLVPGQEGKLRDFFVSCRHRLSLFGATYLTGAILSTVDNGLPRNLLPVTLRLYVMTPAETPERNTWLAIGNVDQPAPIGLETVSWGDDLLGFAVSSMQAQVRYASTSGSKVFIFFVVMARYGIKWEGYLHIAAPRTYQILCPLESIVPSPRRTPECIDEDPMLNGCLGLPGIGQGDPELGLPECDPRHEILLFFPAPTTTGTTTPEATTTTTGGSTIQMFALDPGSNILLSFQTVVPMETPRPYTDNIFRVRQLDPNKVAEDGNLNLIANQVRSSPRVTGFRIWWSRAVPSVFSTVAIEFSFNGTVDRRFEEPNQRLRVIEIKTPKGLSFALQRADDALQLASPPIVPITEWNWTQTMADRLWFGLDMTKNVSGKFHHSFPVMMPTSEVGMPFENLWEIKFCGDSPYCINMILNVPIPGFFFGQRPPFELDMGLASYAAARRVTAPERWSRCLLTVITVFAILVL
jgi:hypothetical protein